MNTRNLFKAIGASLLLTAAGAASAAGETTVQVTASVTAACQFSAATMSAINLGAINPSTVAADVTNTGDITFHCTKGTTPVITKKTGGTVLTSGTNTIAYSFTLGTPEAGKGFSTAAKATPAKAVATATIALANAQDAAAGSYSDTVTLEINN